MRKWMGGKRRKAAVQRRDPAAQQHQFFARNREQAVHATNTLKAPRGISTSDHSRPKQGPSGLQALQSSNQMHLATYRGRKRHRKPPKLSRDLLALAQLNSTDLFRGALQQPRRKRHRSPNQATANGNLDSVREVESVNRTVAVNPKSNSVRVFENDVEKTENYRMQSLDFDQGELQRWSNDRRYLFPRNTTRVNDRRAHGWTRLQTRPRVDPRLKQDDNENFSCFARPNTMDVARGLQSPLFRKPRDPRSRQKGALQSSRRLNSAETRRPEKAFDRKPEKYESNPSLSGNNDTGIEAETPLKASGSTLLSPVHDKNHDLSWDSQAAHRMEPQSGLPTPSHDRSQSIASEGSDESGANLHSTSPSPERSESVSIPSTQIKGPIDQDDFNAEITAIEEKILFSVDESAGKFKAAYTKKSQSFPKAKNMSRQARQPFPTSQQGVQVSEQAHNLIEKGDTIKSLPRQTYLEGVNADQKKGELREDALIVATFCATCPIAAASGEENKSSVLTISPPSPVPEKGISEIENAQ